MAAGRRTAPSLPRLRGVPLWGGLAILLLGPLVGEALTDAVRWGAEDFAAAALLLAGFGLTVELVARLPLRPAGRAAAVGVAALAVLLVWADAAVGVF